VGTALSATQTQSFFSGRSRQGSDFCRLASQHMHAAHDSDWGPDWPDLPNPKPAMPRPEGFTAMSKCWFQTTTLQYLAISSSGLFHIDPS